MTDLLGREQVPDFMRITIEGAGMSLLAPKIAAIGFAVEQAQYDLLASFRDTAPADLERIAEITRTLTEPFLAYLVAPTAERLALSGWVPQPSRSAAMTRREIYEAATLNMWADIGAREHLKTQAKLAELLYGSWFDEPPGL